MFPYMMGRGQNGLLSTHDTTIDFSSTRGREVFGPTVNAANKFVSSFRKIEL